MVCSHSSIYVCFDGKYYIQLLPPPPPHTERVEGILNLKTDDDRRPFFCVRMHHWVGHGNFQRSHVFEFDIFKGYLPKDFLERLLLLLLLCTFIPLLEVLVVPPPPPLPSWNEDLLPFVFLAMHKNFPIWSSILVFARKIANFEVCHGRARATHTTHPSYTTSPQWMVCFLKHFAFLPPEIKTKWGFL